MNSVTYTEKKHPPQGENAVSFPNSGIETRIATVAGLFESRKQAAEAAKVALSSLQRWIAGEGMPAFNSLALLASAVGVSLDWIASGRGEMYPSEGAQAQAVDESIYAYVPLYDARISQGHGAWSDGARILTMLAFTKYSLTKKGLVASQLAAVRVDGDSNEPALKDGDTVMVDLSRNVIQGEAFYVIRLDDLLYAKRLQRQLDGGVLVISANTAYQTISVPADRLERLQVVGRVVWSGGWMI
ncbi:MULTISPECIES: helix-turn-helix transcriptional regulator [Pseudomonas]|uniref:LexA family transcriptional regulator n=1 Tax=Pseudomonas TaxID=286 RepID=UPI001EFB7541|nr:MULTISPECIES: helix-turn-helix transcriptional regulator [Pseudomonas]